MEEIARKKEVFEVIEIKKAQRAMLKQYTAGSTNQFTNVNADYNDPWQPLGSGTILAWYQEDEIDISGLTTHMEKALMVSHCDMNQSPIYAAGTSLSGAPPLEAPTTRGWEVVLLTDVPFDWSKWFAGLDATLLPYRLPGVFSDMSSATTKTLSTDQILFGRMRYLQNDVNTVSNSALVKGESFFGDAKVTMSDRLYLYRFVKYEGTLTTFDQLAVPEFEIVINGHPTELGDLEQIMELRRSYLLQQTIA